MKRFLAWLCGLLSAIGITACDYINAKEPSRAFPPPLRERFGPATWNGVTRTALPHLGVQPSAGGDRVLHDHHRPRPDPAPHRPGAERGDLRQGPTRHEWRPGASPASASRRPASSSSSSRRRWEWRISRGPDGTNDPVFFTVSFTQRRASDRNRKIYPVLMPVWGASMVSPAPSSVCAPRLHRCAGCGLYCWPSKPAGCASFEPPRPYTTEAEALSRAVSPRGAGTTTTARSR